MTSTNHEMSPAELRKFALVTAAMLVLFFDVLIPWIWGFSPPMWPLIAAGALVFTGLLIPKALGPFYSVWMRFAEALGWVNTRIILSVIFFLVFLPFGLIMRAFNDPMRRKLDEDAQSYRIQSKSPKPENMERPF